MHIFSGNEAEFLNEFYEKIEDVTCDLFHQINHSILHDNGFYRTFFSHDELTGLILLNKNFFQNLVGFYEMLNSKLSLPAFNSLRSSIECLRLFRLYFLDNEFRTEYLTNKNLQFDEVRDNGFTQNKIIRKLETLKVSEKHKNGISELLEKSNKSLTKGSAISRLHSELSKWSHSLNINLIAMAHIERNDRKIYLGLDDEFTDIMELHAKKYIEGAYIILTEHIVLFYGVKFNDECQNKLEELSTLYKLYIEKFY